MEKIFEKKMNKMSDKMLRSILTHENLEWREQRSIFARILDPKKSRQDEKTKSWSCSHWHCLYFVLDEGSLCGVHDAMLCGVATSGTRIA